jgi:hypothetical protein
MSEQSIPGARSSTRGKHVASRRWNVTVTAVVFVICGSLAGIARLPETSSSEVSELATHFKFAVDQLPLNPMPASGAVFPVNKTASHMGFYFYQVGVSAALGDLDGDGLPNDLCLTDVRTKTAMVRPVPGTKARYAPFELDFGALVDRTTVHPSVCRFADMNEDGLTDILVAFYGRPPLLLLRQATPELRPDSPLSLASFTVAELVPGLHERWWTGTATFADIDGDGHQDIVVGNYYPDGAELTDGNSDVPFEMNSDFSRARNGGKNRIYLYARSASGAAPSVSYRDAGDVFPNNGAYGWTLAAGAADLDRDGLSELYIANDFGPDQLLRNLSRPGTVRFQELFGETGFARPISTVLGHDSFKSMSIDFGDINNDGVFDMTVSNIGSPFSLQEGHFLWTSTGTTDEAARDMTNGVAPFRDRADPYGVAHSAWGWDTRFEDFDNDGVLELVQATGLVKGNKNRWADFAQLGGSNDLFVKYPRVWPEFSIGSDLDGSYRKPFYAFDKTGRYADLSPVLFPKVLAPTRAVAVADIDGDGYPDMVYGNFYDESVYIRNQTAELNNGNRFLGLHLLLPTEADAGAIAATRIHPGHPAWREGTPAIGAFVEVELPGGQRLIRQVDGGNGHSGQRSAEVRFGLGHVPASDLKVSVTWRDARGALHRDRLSLAPGYHTVVLASKGSNP